MKIYAESHTHDGTGKAGFCPLEPITTQAKTRAGILKAWSKAAAAEYARKLAFQEAHRETVKKFDALAINGVWIAEGRATDGARRYRLTAYAEQGGPVICGVYDTRREYCEYAEEAERIDTLLKKYAIKPENTQINA